MPSSSWSIVFFSEIFSRVTKLYQNYFRKYEKYSDSCDSLAHWILLVIWSGRYILNIAIVDWKPRSNNQKTFNLVDLFFYSFYCSFSDKLFLLIYLPPFSVTPAKNFTSINVISMTWNWYYHLELAADTTAKGRELSRHVWHNRRTTSLLEINPVNLNNSGWWFTPFYRITLFRSLLVQIMRYSVWIKYNYFHWPC